MNIRFFKYHGTGNDFILIDTRMKGNSLPDSMTIKRLCHRRFGIGADGLIALDNVPGYDFGMTYYNSDGKESTMCGNGGRCAVALADFLSPRDTPFHFHAVDGGHTAVIVARKGRIHHVRLKMQDIKEHARNDQDFILDTGSPHLVRFTARETDIISEGRKIRYREEYQPGGVNVNFVSQDRGGIFVRTYERGVEDETLSCGTGVTAAALSLALRNHLTAGPVEVSTKGGKLRVHFNREEDNFNDIWLEGPAELVFEGLANV